jgi:hypothetical protein
MMHLKAAQNRHQRADQRYKEKAAKDDANGLATSAGKAVAKARDGEINKDKEKG